EWQKVYFRLRNSVEGYNGFAKNPLTEAIEQAGSRHIRGRAAQTVHSPLRTVSDQSTSRGTHGTETTNGPLRAAFGEARFVSTSLAAGGLPVLAGGRQARAVSAVPPNTGSERRGRLRHGVRGRSDPMQQRRVSDLMTRGVVRVGRQDGFKDIARPHD